jgi:ankyrin repeat/SAM/basic leucine zipper domain-containing protein 1
LHFATRLGNTDILALLLRHGAFVDAAKSDGYIALNIASKEGQEEVASILFENGASLDVITKKDFTPHCLQIWKCQSGQFTSAT